MATSSDPSTSGLGKLIPSLKKWGPRIIILGIVGAIITALVTGTNDSGSFGLFTAKERIAAVGQNLFYERTIEIEASSFRSKEQCGILAGKRTFELPNLTYVFLEGDRYDLTSMIRVNGRFPKESFVVGNDGCVQISFVSSTNHQFPPQLVRITFR